MRASCAGAISRARTRAPAHLESGADYRRGLELGEIQEIQRCVVPNLTHAWRRASSSAWEARRDARGGAGAISRARTRARAHLEVADDYLELGENQVPQPCVIHNLKHTWPRASSAAGEARCDARGGVGAISRARARADEGARAP